MNSLINAVHGILHAAFSPLLSIFEGQNQFWGLAFVSILLGVILVVIYGKVSRQESIRKVKSQIYRALLESVLFRHDLKLSLKAQGGMLVQAGRYFLLAVPPLIILAVPCLFVLAQLGLWYNARPFTIGQSGIVKVEVAKSVNLMQVSLTAPESVEVTPPVRDAASREIFWRVTPHVDGSTLLIVKVGGKEIQLPLKSGKVEGPIVTASYSTWWDKLLYPEGPIENADSPLKAIEVSYPSSSISIGGIHGNWLVIFFVVSLVSGLIGSKIFGVEV